MTNCANNYCPYQHVEKMIPRQIRNVLIGRKPRLYGEGPNVREWTHVDDHNAAVPLDLRERPHRRNLPDRLRRRAQQPGSPRAYPRPQGPAATGGNDHVADRAGHDLRYSNDSTKIRTELGWTPRYTAFRDGLAATIEWYRSNQAWWEPIKSAIEAAYAAKGSKNLVARELSRPLSLQTNPAR